MFGVLNNKYKSELCRHFETSQCPKKLVRVIWEIDAILLMENKNLENKTMFRY